MRTVAVKSAARILDVLELLAAAPQGVRVNQLARTLDVPKSSASALLATLEGRGYVESAADGYRLAGSYRSGGWVGGTVGALLRVGRPIMEALVQRTHESAFLGVATPSLDIRYVAKVVSSHPLRYDVELATLRPAYCTSIGQVILAALDDEALDAYFRTHPLTRITPRTVTSERTVRRVLREARECGHVTIADSNVMGASGAAAPVTVAGRVVAGLAVIAPTVRFDAGRKAIVPALLAAARAIGEALEPQAGPAPATMAVVAPESRRAPARRLKAA